MPSMYVWPTCYVITDSRVFATATLLSSAWRISMKLTRVIAVRNVTATTASVNQLLITPCAITWWSFVVTSPASIYDVLISSHFPLLVPLCLSNSYALLKYYTYCLHVSSRFLTSILSSYSRSWTYYTNTYMSTYYHTHTNSVFHLLFVSFCGHIST